MIPVGVLKFCGYTKYILIFEKNLEYTFIHMPCLEMLLLNLPVTTEFDCGALLEVSQHSRLFATSRIFIQKLYKAYVYLCPTALEPAFWLMLWSLESTKAPTISLCWLFINSWLPVMTAMEGASWRQQGERHSGPLPLLLAV